MGTETVILWASKLLSASSPTPSNILGPPDGQSTTLSTTGQVVVAAFRGGGFYPLLSLLTGVTAAQLARADVIAFELNGNAPAPSGGWESTRWTFEDGTNSATVDWNEVAGTANPTSALVASGSIAGASYATFFGFSSAGVGKVVSYILLSLPAPLDLSSGSLRIKITGWNGTGHGEGTPDPDAIGIFPCHRPRKDSGLPPK